MITMLENKFLISIKPLINQKEFYWKLKPFLGNKAFSLVFRNINIYYECKYECKYHKIEFQKVKGGKNCSYHIDEA